MVTAFALGCKGTLLVLFLSNILMIIFAIITAATSFMATSFSFSAGPGNKKPGQLFDPTGLQGNSCLSKCLLRSLICVQITHF